MTIELGAEVIDICKGFFLKHTIFPAARRAFEFARISVWLYRIDTFFGCDFAAISMVFVGSTRKYLAKYLVALFPGSEGKQLP